MSKKLITAAALIGLGAYGLHSIPNIHLSKTSQFLKEAGFSNITYTSAEATLTTISFTDIALDPEKISTIKSLTITLSPWKLFSGKIKSVHIQNPDIIASLDDNNRLIIDNFNDTNLLQSTSPSSPRTITITNAELTILTDEWAAITANFNLTANKNDKDEYDYQANFTSKQKNLSLSGNASGTSSLHQLRTDLEIETGKLALPDKNFRLTRINGTANITVTPGQSPQILADLKAGGLKAGPTVWQNISATLHTQNGANKANLSAQSLGIEGLTLSAAYQKDASQIIVTSPSKAKTLDYLVANKTDKAAIKQYGTEILKTEIEFQDGHIDTP